MLSQCKSLIGCYLIKITGVIMGSAHVRLCWQGIWNFIGLLILGLSKHPSHTLSSVYQKSSEVHHFSSDQTSLYRPRTSASHTVVCVRVCECVVKVAGLKQLCATDKPFVTLRQTNFLNLWQPSDSSLHLFRLLSIQVTHRGLWISNISYLNKSITTICTHPTRSLNSQFISTATRFK